MTFPIMCQCNITGRKFEVLSCTLNLCRPALKCECMVLLLLLFFEICYKLLGDHACTGH
jgi:hypothetical protein